MEHSFDETDQICINTIRTLSMDAVQAANSGHPGTPMALAPIAYLLYTKFLKHCPDQPDWPDRDRFILSCGHASMLQYSILHLTGYDLSLDDIRAFRQWDSKTPGHPELGVVPGVEITTGPLGQGCATSVGFAFAEAHLAERFNSPTRTVVNHRTWVVCSDGDLMEGVAYEAASVAGHLGLDKLTWIWDDNRITIEGDTDLAFTEDVRARFEACGWHILTVDDANDLIALSAAFQAAIDEQERPTLIAVKSRIAWGAPTKENTPDAHGAPLGEEEIRGAKAKYGWPQDETFVVPSEAIERCKAAIEPVQETLAQWQDEIAAWANEKPQEHGEWQRRVSGKLPAGWDNVGFSPQDVVKPMATRVSSGKVLNALAEHLPELVGGSADLAPSTKTIIGTSGDVRRGTLGERNLHFGIREHSMGSMLNGMALHGGFRPYGATFLVFADYMRPAIRLAALMELPVIYVFTHDSIWVGEDGPTHQPIEHVASLRLIPGLTVLRPADAAETEAAWKTAIENTHGPVALILSRQGLPQLEATSRLASTKFKLGAYALVEEATTTPDVVLLASGSEVHLIVEAARQLAAQEITARVVSMPSWELFAAQDPTYREALLPPGIPKLAIEAGTTMGWHRWTGESGEVIGLDRFGASAPGKTVAKNLGLTVDAVIDATRRLLQQS